MHSHIQNNILHAYSYACILVQCHLNWRLLIEDTEPSLIYFKWEIELLGARHSQVHRVATWLVFHQHHRFFAHCAGCQLDPHSGMPFANFSVLHKFAHHKLHHQHSVRCSYKADNWILEITFIPNSLNLSMSCYLKLRGWTMHPIAFFWAFFYESKRVPCLFPINLLGDDPLMVSAGSSAALIARFRRL